ncbi:multidrug transporter [Gallibacterium salpingitidis]|uniref:Multidrug transporter n=1 Tax=Gallibacterium salpingitidis TaxID=505341 RepID=A0AB36E1D9_9PAST|nr:MFS transporter [Gallibacterium salpingitidis]OBX05896.1 multidrug transporter [Gallibacterium salpingitidis]OBX09420.1 multidrug transporter [Gallibacterium salpingitidis]
MKKYITLIALFLGQGLTGSIISLLILTATLVGLQLSPNSYLTTLPITATVLGSAVMVYYASNLMSYYGRRKAFIIGSVIGLFGSILACAAIYFSSFFLFVIAALILGAATIFNQYYRFTAAEVFASELAKKRATALIIGSGVIGGFLGPFIATQGEYLFAQYPFLGSFLFAAIIFILAMISQLFIFIKEIKHNKAKSSAVDKQLFYSTKFILATISCAFAFAIMTLIMNAVPLAMHHVSLTTAQSASVLQWHFLAMYLPALFLPFVLEKLKTLHLIQLGAFCFIFGNLAAFSLDNYWGYIITLVFVGLGWSFMFTGGTFIVNQLSDESSKHKLQGMNSLITYLLSLVASLSVGFIMSYAAGWLVVNILAMIIMVITSCYLLLKRKLFY